MFSEGALDAEIVSAVEGEWRQHNVPLLFSHLGLARISSEAKQFVKDHQISLKRYIKHRFDARLRLVPMQRQGGGVVPFELTKEWTDSQLEEAFEKLQATRATSVPKRLSFKTEIWDAFIEPIPDGHHRVINLSSAVPVVRLDVEDAPKLDGDILIKQNEISSTPAGIRPDPEEARRAILEWGERHGLAREDLEAGAKQRPAKLSASGQKNSQDEKLSKSVEFLRSLSKEELIRVIIPGDVVLAILERAQSR